MERCVLRRKCRNTNQKIITSRYPFDMSFFTGERPPCQHATVNVVKAFRKRRRLRFQTNGLSVDIKGLKLCAGHRNKH